MSAQNQLRDPAVSSAASLVQSLPANAAFPSEVRVVLPAYNEQDALPAVVPSIASILENYHIQYSIIVVDDGSSDGTAAVTNELAKSFPVDLVQHEVNKGLGVAMQTGFQYALQKSHPNDIVITLDSDDTHPAGLMVRMIQMIHEGHDVVIASRFRPGARTFGVPLNRTLFSLGGRVLFTTFFPTKGLREYTCGYRAYSTKILEKAVKEYGNEFINESGFSCQAEIIIKLRRLKAVIGEAPLILRYDKKQGDSKMNVSKTIWQTLGLLFRLRFTK